MDAELGAWLRRQREDHGWNKHEMARRLIQAGRDADDKAMPEISGMIHNIHRWEREGGVSERHKLHYCRAFAIHPSQFGPGHPAAPGRHRDGRDDLPCARSGPFGRGWRSRPTPAPTGCRRLPWNASTRFG